MLTALLEALGCAHPPKGKQNLERHQPHMQYVTFRAQGLFVGSGVIEAGCKTLIGKRLKQSGMKWSLKGANSIIALRCMIQSDRLEDYWESRRFNRFATLS